jgi:hypothetical protein
MSTAPRAIADDLMFQPPLLVAEVPDPATESEERLRFRANLEREITSVSGRIESPAVLEILQVILSDLIRFFEWLARVDDNLHKLDTLLESLSLLEVLQFEAHGLVEFIETKAIPSVHVDERLREVLEGIVYGINHDLRRVFERELVRTLTQQSTPLVYGKILHAHGLLTNCFQQSTITLLQVFKPSVNGGALFNDAELRLKQSLVLCRELSSLMRIIERTTTQPDPDLLRKAVQKILEFRDGSMQFLMYKDWRGYERLALEVVTAIENNLDSQPLLHQFHCYLEVLYGHVKMRAVLATTFSYSDALDND